MKLNAEYVISIQRMVCTNCGAEANASCNCGKPYIAKKQQAVEAIAANPQKSDRAIAADIGVSHETVSKARRETGVNELTPEREGRDGKVYRLPAKERPEQTPADEAAESFKILVDLALRIENLDLSLIRGIPGIKMHARRVSEAWSRAEEKL